MKHKSLKFNDYTIEWDNEYGWVARNENHTFKDAYTSVTKENFRLDILSEIYQLGSLLLTISQAIVDSGAKFEILPNMNNLKSLFDIEYLEELVIKCEKPDSASLICRTNKYKIFIDEMNIFYISSENNSYRFCTIYEEFKETSVRLLIGFIALLEDDYDPFIIVKIKESLDIATDIVPEIAFVKLEEFLDETLTLDEGKYLNDEWRAVVRFISENDMNNVVNYKADLKKTLCEYRDARIKSGQYPWINTDSKNLNKTEQKW